MKKILLSFFVVLITISFASAQNGWDDDAPTKKADVKKPATVVSDPVADYPPWNSVPVFTPVKPRGTGASAQMRTGVIAPGVYSKVHAISFKVLVGYDENKKPVYSMDNTMSVMFNTPVAFKQATKLTVMCWANPDDDQPIIWGN